MATTFKQTPDKDYTDTVDNGVATYYAVVVVTDIDGKHLLKRLSLGKKFCCSVDTARDTMTKVRADNDGLDIVGSVSFKL